jgi:lipooligosaccharide transport system permease protein
MAMSSATLIPRVVPPALFPGGRAVHLVERNLMVVRRSWLVFLSGFFEPLFYLLSIGVGISKLTGDITLSNGAVITYTAFIAPAMMASSAMNGAVYDATFNIFFKLKYAKLYDAVLSTPLNTRDVATGEIIWAQLRGFFYAASFLLVMLIMGLVGSWWAILMIPGALLIGFAFAAVCMAATTYMRSWQDFEFVTLSIMPMFLFSATFYPLETYPDVLQLVVQATPLYHGVAMLRALSFGVVDWGILINVAYLLAMGLLGLAIASRRLEKLLLH